MVIEAIKLFGRRVRRYYEVLVGCESFGDMTAIRVHPDSSDLSIPEKISNGQPNLRRIGD